ncbi:MAG: YlmC/YmxH family sporulation protein [Clostridia bacterium]|nr:YlmC/YmxH family sporulation protein [Clostridia bacterium]
MEQKLTFSDLKSREVINIADGARLGCVCDLELEIPSGRILALIVPGESKWFGLLKGDDGLIIPYHRIKKFGEDVILVELC